ncbi:MAG: DUF1524 domain-containing protein [Gammaproteobacteria bacterium]|nr:DUF1524 domain-containing protein [Gammaproteobacteria bacterium]MYH85580.1 DUF1524 domain-containing protein [Gammaproteobacteria bacterium]MYK05134.1 DUF1524 domain-containing protein [Gammaproteobacteria bacterium]
MRLVVVNSVLTLLIGGSSTAFAQETWLGLVIAPEYRCSTYDRSDYPYSQSVERQIIAELGGRIYSPYTGAYFGSPRETDIEHMVSLSEAHDSGLCGRSAAVKRQFASDLLNLTLAAPRLNRNVKTAKDVAEWTPALNACWFVARTIEVRQKYGLTIDRAEAVAAQRVLSQCDSVEMEFVVNNSSNAQPARPPTVRNTSPPSDLDALQRWDDNGNGRITCAEARRHGIAPVPRAHPAYRYMRDGDGDGVVCE